MAIIFQFVFIGIPLIYYGDEIGMTGKNDPDCRRPMEWDQSKWNKNIFDIYKLMTALRNNHVCLRRGSFETLLMFDKLIAFKRKYNDEEIISIFNPGPLVSDVKIPSLSTSNKWFDLFIKERTYSTKNGILFIDKVKPNTTILISNKEEG